MRVDHGSGLFQGILYSVQSTSLLDINTTSVIDQDSKHSAVADMHGDDQGVVVWEINCPSSFENMIDLLKVKEGPVRSVE